MNFLKKTYKKFNFIKSKLINYCFKRLTKKCDEMAKNGDKCLRAVH